MDEETDIEMYSESDSDELVDALNNIIEQLEEKVIANKIKFVDKTSLELVEDLFFKLSMMGFALDDDKYERDNALVSEAVKSVMLKSLGIHHDLQIAAEELIDIEEDEIEEDD